MAPRAIRHKCRLLPLLQVAAALAPLPRLAHSPRSALVPAAPPLRQDVTTVVPPPFNLQRWLARHAAALDAGASLDLFEGHPDREFRVRVVGGASEQRGQAWQVRHAPRA